MNRRQFIQSAAAAAVGTAVAPAEEKEPALPIVDTHQHLWDLSKFRLPWIKKGSPLAKSFLMKDYLEATAGLNVVKAVYMEVDVEPAQQLAEAEYVVGLCK